MDVAHIVGLCLQLGEFSALILSGKQDCSLSLKKTLPHLSRLLDADTALKNGLCKE